MVETTTLVLSPSGTFSTDFIIAEGEDRPDADPFADGIAILDLDMEDFGHDR